MAREGLNKRGDRRGMNNPIRDMSGEKNSNWKGGKHHRKDGYHLIRVGGRYRLKHRVVMEEHLGRPLLRAEIVHHKNGNNSDNRVSNLQVMTQAEHARHHGLTNNPFKGRKHTKETIAKIQKGRAWWRPTDEHKKKTGIGLRRYYQENPEAKVRLSKISSKVAAGRMRNKKGRFI